MSRASHAALRSPPAYLLGLALAALLLGGLAPASAWAGFGPIQLQSVDALEQAPSAGEPTISADGRYLAFTGTFGGVSGVWRKELQTGHLQLVASQGGAPSISADGRYVSFTSTVALLPAAVVGRNVYVRDMNAPLPSGEGCDAEEEAGANGRACAFQLASALNGSKQGIAGGGAVASGRVALSADGREVAFVLTGPSDLMSGDPATLSTPGGQVVVRYLDPPYRTVLVSAEREAGTGAMSERPVAAGAVTGAGAALSGDGSAVAWLGAHIPAQAPTLEGERQAIEFDDAHAEEAYDEPLWRRIADGPAAPTRRIVGGGDPLAPGCQPGGTLQDPACRGPFPELLEDKRGGLGSNLGWLAFAGYDGTPQLSFDGFTIALIGDPRPPDAPSSDEGGTSNVFVVDMHEGLDRVQALRQLTLATPALNTPNPGQLPGYVASAGDVYDIAISPDGSRIAFTTQRQQFQLSPLVDTEPPPGELGVLELYEIVDDEALVRVTHGPGGGPSLEGREASVARSGASAPSFTADDRTLAFADTASNLVYGDSNGASDVFTVSEVVAPSRPGAVEIGSASTQLAEPAAPRWRLSVVPILHRDGSITLDVAVPGAGELSAAALATVPVSVPVRPARRARHAGRSRARGTRLVLSPRVIARASMAAALPELLELPLRVAAPYAHLLGTPAGLYATVRVAFSGDGGPPLVQTVTVSLRKTRVVKAGRLTRSRVAPRSHARPRARALGRGVKNGRVG